MSVEKVTKLLEELRTNEKAQELFGGAQLPESIEDMAKVIVEAAGKLGIAADEAEVLAGLKELEADKKARTDAAAAKMGELDDEELEKVVGGAYPAYDCTNYSTRSCAYDFTDDSCSMKDACKFFWVYYLSCRYTYHG